MPGGTSRIWNHGASEAPTAEPRKVESLAAHLQTVTVCCPIPSGYRPNHALMCFLCRMTGREGAFLYARDVYIERASLPSHHILI